MKFTGNIRKMSTSLVDGKANYILPLKDVLEDGVTVNMNDLVGKPVALTFENQINCVVSGKRIKKTYGEGMSFDAWQKSPQAVESIIRPELSRIHEGIALRDFDWEQAHHNQPHYLYLSVTSDLKVGVTRTTNVPSRWIDQGASQAIVVAETPYRQLAGLMEVELKSHLADKTNWRGMLTNVSSFDDDLEAAKNQVFEWLDEQYEDFFSDDDDITNIEYPVLEYPNKITSFKLDTQPVTTGILKGIRGQYLYFENGKVINIRSHAGYRISIEA